MAADQDIALLEKVLMRFALSEENQLEKCLESFLAASLLKLGSPNEATRKKVLEILAHINKRVKTQQTILLPIEDLLVQYLDPDVPAIVRNFDIVYLEMGWNRLPLVQRKTLAPSLLTGISNRPPAHQDIFLHLFLSVAEHIAPPKEDTEIPQKFPFLEIAGVKSAQREADTRILLDFFLDILLMPPPNQIRDLGGAIVAPPGHSMNSLTRIMGKQFDKYTADPLLARKLGIVTLIAHGIFPETKILPHLIVASCDPHHTVVGKAEDFLKRISKPDMEDTKLIEQLYSLFTGTPPNAAAVPAEQKVKPVTPLVRTKIFVYFSKSVLAANKFPATLQIIFESVYGADTSMRLQQGAMSFVQWVFRQAVDAQLATMAPIILSGLMKLLDTLKDESGKDVNELKSFTYSAIGLLAKRVKSLFSKDISVLSVLLSRLGSEDQRVAGSIYEALAMLRPAYTNPDPEVAKQIEVLLLENSEKADHQARLATVQYANFVYPFSHNLARYICVVCAGDARPEIRDEAKKGLKPYLARDGDVIPDDTQEYPDFSSLVRYLADMRNDRVSKMHTKTTQEQLGLTQQSYEQMIILLRNCIKKNATHKGLSTKTYLAGIFNSGDEKNPIDLYRGLIEVSLGQHAGEEVHFASSVALLELITNLPSQLAPQYATKFAWLKSQLYFGKNESREVVAKILGLVAPFLPESERLENIKFFTQQTTDASVPSQSQFSAVWSVGCIIGKVLEAKEALPADVTTESSYKLFKIMEGSNMMLAVAACNSIGMMGRFVPLPVPDTTAAQQQKSEETPVAVAVAVPVAVVGVVVEAAGPHSVTKKQIITKLIALLDNTERKLSETAALSLGYIALGDRNIAFADDILQGLFKLAGNKNEELQFTVGEVLSCLAVGDFSTAAHDPYSSYSPDEAENDNDDDVKPKLDLPDGGEKLTNIIDQVLTSHLTDRRPPIHRCAACIWLMSLVKHTGHLAPVRTRLPQIQLAFSSLLSDSNEITQEVASRGLVLVYEKGDEKIRKELVNGLVRTLSTGKSAQSATIGSEQLFPEGALGSAPQAAGGGGLSTYKELCAVANEMGQPDLIYKFMNLASHHALWNTKKGAAFAATTLASKASDQIKPFLPGLVPKLYRYSYDPNPKVAAAMGNILRALIDPKKALDGYFEPILAELIQGIGSRQWRVREASCSALGDALQGKGLKEIGDKLGDLYVMSFRALDDIKETVRKAAQVALRTLGGLTVRLCDPQYTAPQYTKQTLEIALPFLLQKGIMNEAAEVRHFALGLILKIVKVAQQSLSAFIPDLVGTLVEALTTLEPQEFNYMAFHAEKMDITQDQLETARLAVSKLSPINDTLDMCIKHVDKSNVEELVDRLIEVVKRGVGMSTRVGTAKFITTMAYTHGEVVKPHAPRLLLALLGALEDKSTSVRRAFATALATVAKLAAPKNIKSLLGALIEKYKTATDDSRREGVAVAFRELLRVATVQVRQYDKDIVPFLYFAKNDPTEAVHAAFKDIWGDIGTGGARLAVGEIVEDITISMTTSSSWTTKQQAAQTLNNLATDLGKSLGIHAVPVVKLLLAGLSGKTYKGKEALLGALSSVCAACAEDIHAGVDVNEMVVTVLAECKRTDKDYKRHAVNCLGSLLKSFPTVDVYEETSVVLAPLMVDAPPVAVGTKEEEEDDVKSKPLNLLIRANAFEALSSAYAAASPETRKAKAAHICDALATQYPLNPWNVQISILGSIRSVVKANASSDMTSEDTQKLIGVLISGMENAKYSMVRKAALETLLDWVVATKDSGSLAPHVDSISRQLEALSKDNMVTLQVEKLKEQLQDYHAAKKAKTV